ncbi:MAG: class I SAM-dependent methyltransferase [Saprospiraceae bacterium]
MKEFWDERFKDEKYAYGTAPNNFFKEVLDSYPLKGNILLPAEGEGRNAIYAAEKGLNVHAFDISIEGKNKAEKLAQKRNVKINYEIGDFPNLELSKLSFDVAALIYAHFPPNILSAYHKKIGELIKPNGIVILEGFSKNNLPLREANPKIGGPPNIDMLFSIEEIKKDFSNFKIIKLEEQEVELNEGMFHIGTGKVVRFIGIKNNS